MDIFGSMTMPSVLTTKRALAMGLALVGVAAALFLFLLPRQIATRKPLAELAASAPTRAGQPTPSNAVRETHRSESDRSKREPRVAEFHLRIGGDVADASLEGGQVVVTTGSNPELRLSADSNANGVARILVTASATGPWTINVLHRKFFAPRYPRRAEQLPALTEVEMRPRMKVTGRVIDEIGQPVAKANIYRLWVVHDESGHTWLEAQRVVVTGATGRFSPELKCTGHALEYLNVWRAGFVPTTVPLLPQRPLQLTLRRGLTLRGRLVDQDGLGVPKVHISFAQMSHELLKSWKPDDMPAEHQGSLGTTGAWLRTDSSGKFSLSGWPRGARVRMRVGGSDTVTLKGLRSSVGEVRRTKRKYSRDVYFVLHGNTELMLVAQMQRNLRFTLSGRTTAADGERVPLLLELEGHRGRMLKECRAKDGHFEGEVVFSGPLGGEGRTLFVVTRVKGNAVRNGPYLTKHGLRITDLRGDAK